MLENKHFFLFIANMQNYASSVIIIKVLQLVMTSFTLIKIIKELINNVSSRKHIRAG